MPGRSRVLETAISNVTSVIETVGAFAGLIALLVLRRTAFLPFGPALSAAAIAYVLFGDALVAYLFPNMARLL